MRIFVSVILSIILTVALLVCGISVPVASNLSYKNVTSSVNRTIQETASIIKNMDFTKDESEMTETEKACKELVENLEEQGINRDDFVELMEDEEISEFISKTVSSTVVSKLDSEQEVYVPSREELTEILYKKRFLIQDTFKPNPDISQYSKEDFAKYVDENYDEIIEIYMNYAGIIGG